MPMRTSVSGREIKLNEWTCWVCLDDNACSNNKLVKCDGRCKVVVHQLCYGVETVPTGVWKCDRCSSDSRRSATLKCALCPVREGPLKPTENGEWCHVICALFVPTVTFANESRMSPISIRDVKRSDARCSLCTAKGDYESAKYGICIKCNDPQCAEMFHVGCAWEAELLVELEVETPAREKGGRGAFKKCSYVGFCKAHYCELDANDKNNVLIRRYQVQPPETDTSGSSGQLADSLSPSGRRPRGRPRRVKPSQSEATQKQVSDEEGSLILKKPVKRHSSMLGEGKVKREHSQSADSSSHSQVAVAVSSQQALAARLPKPRLVFEPSSRSLDTVRHSVSESSRRNCRAPLSNVTSVCSSASLSSNAAITQRAINNDLELANQLDELAVQSQDSLLERVFLINKRYFDRVTHFTEHVDDSDESEDSVQASNAAACVKLSFVELLTFLSKMDEREAWLSDENHKLERQLQDLQQHLQSQSLFFSSSAARQLPVLPVTIAGTDATVSNNLNSVIAQFGPTGEPNNNKLATAACNGSVHLHSPNTAVRR